MPNRFEKYAQPQPQMVAPNPMFPGQMQGQALNNQGQGLTNARTQAELPYVGPKAAADARIAQLQAQITAIQAGAAGAKSQADLDQARLQIQKLGLEIQALQSGKGGALQALQNQVDRVQHLYQNNLQGGLPNVVNRVIPDSFQPGKAQFDTAGEGLTNPFMAAFRIPGVGSQSDTELRQFIQANVPHQGDNDQVIEEKIRNIQNRIDSEKEARGITPSKSLPPILGGDEMQIEQATGKTRSIVDPALKATSLRVGRMISKGVPDAQILDFLQKSGVDPASTNVGPLLNYRAGKLSFPGMPSFKEWQRANPGKAYPVGPSFYTKEVPLTGGRKLFNKAAATDVGGAAAAGLAASANAISGGRLDNAVGYLSGDPEMAKTGMELLRTNHPVASFAGDMAGQASVEALLGRIPGARSLLSTKAGRRLEDFGYGAYSGSGENDADPLSGAVTGALTNMGFGMAGRGAQRGAGRTLAGVRDAHLGYLDRSDVPLTIGQIGRGSDNIIGNAVGGLEERARGLPGFDAVIGAARQRGDEGFNRAAFREMGGTGATGAAGLLEGRQLTNDAYSFLDPINLPLDAQFAGSQAAVRASIPDLPKYGPELTATLDVIDRASRGGSISGRDWRSALSNVKGDRSNLAGQPFSTQARQTLGDVGDNLADLASRQGPPDVQASLANANRLNAQVKTLEAALDNGPAQKAGELFSAGRLDDASRTNARAFQGRSAALTGNRPFYDLTTAGKAVMPNLTPDSGTAGRILLVPAAAAAAGTLGGFLSGEDNKAQSAGVGLGGGLALAGLLSAPYSKTGQRLIQRALLGQRPRKIVRLGDYLINNPNWAGRLGSALGRDYVYQDELPE